MTGALTAISAHVTSGVPPPGRRGSKGSLVPARSLGHPHERLGLDDC